MTENGAGRLKNLTNLKGLSNTEARRRDTIENLPITINEVEEF